ncbi:MAG: DUF3160 domain-containing protein [Lachnospiraceae bacterium]|nr:DUF3160 domain-containing protein [Lachnospiraceae bacterium]
MKRKRIKGILAVVLVISILCACAGTERESGTQNAPVEAENVKEGETQEPAQEENAESADAEADNMVPDSVAQENADAQGSDDDNTDMETLSPEELEALLADIKPIDRPFTGDRPFLVKSGDEQAVDMAAPSVEAYTVAPDLSNVDNLWQFYLQDGFKTQLAENGFVVFGEAGFEFYEIYENNRYEQIANFVTVDSMMHTYHLYFAYLMKNVEKEYLYAYLTLLSRKMLESSVSQYELLKGSEWEEAAMRNVAFFTIGAALLGDRVEAPDYVEEIVSYELDAIGQAGGIKESKITGEFEDYTQYKPRGYYADDIRLERYFQAMMWYGRIHFAQDNVELDRSALLIAEAVLADEEIYGLWEAVYAVTSFFAGASDDAGVCEYIPLMKEAYGEDITVNGLIGTQEEFARFHEMTAKLTPPQINTIPIEDGESNVIPGFRFMGQRFTIDAAVMQKLIFSSVGEDGAGGRRMLPDVLDVPAALGSDTALQILEENGAADYAGYSENMEKLRMVLAADKDTLWSASLYAGWLNTLRPLLEVKGEGYPVFMQGEEWAKKNLECFAGSFTELKHDTVLYSKQVMAEMGGGWEQEPDDRGYVEPEPLVYMRFENLAVSTAEGLKAYGVLRTPDEANLSRLSELAHQLYVISNKELRDEVLTEEEYELIRCYGGNIEHFWYETFKAEIEEEGLSGRDCPAAVVVDIATDPNGAVLEAATGNPSDIYVLVKIDGKIKIARGAVYSFYQFTWPMEDRLTDSEWRQMIGAQVGDDGYYDRDPSIQQPEWTESYRYQWE